ncbi:MAG: KTSC domain-containing protein [Cetobacterium somerae]
MVIKSIESSNLKTMMYDKNQNILYVIFNEGSMYLYRNVTEKEFNKLFNNKKNTIGELFYSNIREVKPCKKIY